MNPRRAVTDLALFALAAGLVIGLAAPAPFGRWLALVVVGAVAGVGGGWRGGMEVEVMNYRLSRLLTWLIAVALSLAFYGLLVWAAWGLGRWMGVW